MQGLRGTRAFETLPAVQSDFLLRPEISAERFKNHEGICAGIRQLECIENEKLHKGRGRVRSKLVDLVGDRCMVKCLMDGSRVEALWDTGSQLTVVGMGWLGRHFPRKKVKNLRELLEYDLDVGAAGGSNIPYSGFVVLTFCLDVEKGDSIELEVPVLVGKCGFDTPLIGNNVINALAHLGEKRRNISEAMGQNYVDGESTNVFEIIAREAKRDASVLEVFVQKGFTVKPNLSGYIQTKIDGMSEGGEFLFEGEDETGLADQLVRVPKGGKRFKVEVVNNTCEPIRFEKNSRVGNLSLTTSTVPFELHTKRDVTQNEDGKTETDKDHLPELSIDATLTDEQRVSVQQMLGENAGVFARDESELGSFEGLEMKINLTDNVPVRRHYNSIPRPLYEDVRNHITDMLHRGIIQPSISSYSSPLVLVRKKDGNLRICVDYRAVNAKAVGESNPIPRIQDIIDSLGGMTFFSTIDMKEAYQ